MCSVSTPRHRMQNASRRCILVISTSIHTNSLVGFLPLLGFSAPRLPMQGYAHAVSIGYDDATCAMLTSYPYSLYFHILIMLYLGVPTHVINAVPVTNLLNHSVLYLPLFVECRVLRPFKICLSVHKLTNVCSVIST